jgi:hypothetical protein
MLDVTDYVTLTPTRAADEANNTRAPLAPITAVVFLNDPETILTERGKRWTQTGVLRVLKNDDGSPLDLLPGDEITLPQGNFGIVGGIQQNRVHSLTGTDFGWVRYTIRKVG